MFTWICPECGREVPPAYNECPDCAARAAGTPAAEPPAAEPPTVAPPPAAPPPSLARPPARPRPAPRGAVVPVWALAIMLVFAAVGLGSGVYWIVQATGRPGDSTGPAARPKALGKAGRGNPFQKLVEVTGLRVTENEKTKQVMATFVVVNHSTDDLAGLEGTVTIWGRTQNSGEESAGKFRFKVGLLKAMASAEGVAPVTTTKRVYELPDWQNADLKLEVTAPAL